MAVGQSVLLNVAPGLANFPFTKNNVAVSKDKIAVLAGYISGPLTLKTFDLAGHELASNPSSDASEDCKLVMTTRSDGVDVLLTVVEKTTAAAGINPASTTRTLVASDASTLKQLWTLPLHSPDPGTAIDNGDFCSPGATTGQDLASRVQFTSDGAWALVTLFQEFTGAPLAVDLKTGAAHPVQDVKQVVGPYLLAVRGGDAVPMSVDVLSPSTGATIGSTTSASVLRSLSNLVPATTDPPLVIAGSPRSGNDNTGVVQGLRLPTLTPIWQAATPSDIGELVTYEDQMTHTLVLTSAAGGPATALSEATGAMLCTAPSDEVCAAADGKVLITANDQLAVLDAGTGKQISYDPSTPSCPAMLSNGYSYKQNGHTGTITVTRTL